jgi:hypothetical protein
MWSLARRTREWLFLMVTVTVLVQFNRMLTRTLPSLFFLNDDGYKGQMITSSEAAIKSDVIEIQMITSSEAAITSDLFEIPQEVIDQARKRAKQFNATLAIDQVRILVDNHPAFRKIQQQYQPKQWWKQLYFPDVSIAGLQKAGSSQLYNILTSHSDMFNFHSEKEFHFGIPHLTLDVSKLLSFSQNGDSDASRRNRVSFIQRFFHGRFKYKSF